MVHIVANFTVTDLVIQATSLLKILPDQWYKGCSELMNFQSDLKILTERSNQWESQLKRYGKKEDPILAPFILQAAELLNEEEQFYEKTRKSWALRLTGRLFNSKLAYMMSNIRKVVEAGPELLAESIEMHEILNKSLLMDSSGLPFGYDPKYVPLQETVDEVQSALENLEGQQVVTLWGAPGMGKSSLAKYVALRYQNSISRSTSYFDGIQYLYCGQGCRANTHQLRKQFFSDLGFGALFSSLEFDTNTEQVQGCDRNLSLYQSAARGLLAEKKLLIIIDDLWVEDFEVLANFVCRGALCKYLVTSQTRDVWHDARCILIPSPTHDQALRILGNHLQGISSQEQNPFREAIVEDKISEILKKLENHPLSVVSVAASMSRNGEIDQNHWRSVAQNIFAFLDESHHSRRILVYERPYSPTLSVSATMMLMVESLRGAERDLLFLIALFQGIWTASIPQHVVKYFMRRLHRGNFRQITFSYYSALKYLEDNSLVHVARHVVFETSSTFSVDSMKINRKSLTIHNLRREYIRRKHLQTLRSMARDMVSIRGNGDGHLAESSAESPVNVEDRGERLAVVLGTVHFCDGVIGEVALRFRSVVTHMNSNRRVDLGLGHEQRLAIVPFGGSGGAVPQGLEQSVDARELAKTAKHVYRGIFILEAMHMIMELLTLEGEERWKQQVSCYASKVQITTKLVCKEELDDASVASLLTIPHVTGAASQIFCNIYKGLYHDRLKRLYFQGQRKSLSDVLPATWRALSILLYSNKLRSAQHGSYWRVSDMIKSMLEFESDSTILVELQNLRELADRFRDRPNHNTVRDAFLGLHTSRLSFHMLHGTWPGRGPGGSSRVATDGR